MFFWDFQIFENAEKYFPDFLKNPGREVRKWCPGSVLEGVYGPIRAVKSLFRAGAEFMKEGSEPANAASIESLRKVFLGVSWRDRHDL